jgi:uncharacterized membrane protein
VWAAAGLAIADWNAGTGSTIGDLTGLIFQVGLGGLLLVQLRTGATGTSKTAVVLLRVQLAVLAVAAAWSLVHGVLPSPADEAAWLMVGDAAWPLSMLGMAIIGVVVAAVGRWRGLLRWWPLFAQSWLLVALPAQAVLGEGAAATAVGVAHLLLGYGVLGVLLARRPEDTLPVVSEPG